MPNLMIIVVPICALSLTLQYGFVTVLFVPVLSSTFLERLARLWMMSQLLLEVLLVTIYDSIELRRHHWPALMVTVLELIRLEQ